MEWLNKFKGTVKKTADKAFEKSSQIVETTKISYKINEAEGVVDKLYLELGTKVYDSYKEGNELSEELKNICNAIDNKYFEIGTLKNQIDEIKEVQTCKNCGAKNPFDSKYCKSCGEKLD